MLCIPQKLCACCYAQFRRIINAQCWVKRCNSILVELFVEKEPTIL